MTNIKEIYDYLKTINFDGFQFKSEGKVCMTIENSKLFTESHYASYLSAKNDWQRKVQYNALKVVYDHFKK
jgi:hypothetical protein